ncbi:3'(2'), 5'-bisphosphate nucleotidase [Motilibacter peucedani]|uniref:3'(2'), 5'-bisphosphate nucleotidase n=1 Tax=Motilibacter peucedani TaxID=598650 RepID=A0A420XMU1_9ACTN|nr:3'(2'),5'-bisphosphate nucleotidase CysQ [Motilibacter peucedani]RKS72600.1 3'(2'), 5'-bisphosphate nucleotidase [Motilibacter peucedani]
MTGAERSASTASDVAVARAAAGEAADVLLALRATYPDAPDLRDRGDRAAHETIVELLARLRPGDAVLSEEGVDDPARLSARRVWIVDPLDGTREFGEAGRPDWAVHVALWQDGELTDAAVALPGLGTVLATDDVPPPPPRDGRAAPRFAVSRTRATALVTGVAEALGGELVPLGSAGYKAAAVVRGEVDAYVHTGGQYEWDSAAPVAVARAAGLHTSRVDGSPLLYNQADVSLPDLVVCRAELADDVLAAIARLSQQSDDAGKETIAR